MRKIYLFIYSRQIAMIRFYGYPAELHKVITKDGYILELHRIPGRRGPASVPVIIQHGITSSSADFLSNRPPKNLRKFSTPILKNIIINLESNSSLSLNRISTGFLIYLQHLSTQLIDNITLTLFALTAITSEPSGTIVICEHYIIPPVCSSVEKAFTVWNILMTNGELLSIKMI